MTQWYVKDLSKLTQVSVQTLHHYDRIGLLKPSVRLANGYRLYSEKDLLKLQQIIALKFFGFELSQIKMLLAADVDVLDHFSAQSQFLADKAKSLFEASNALKTILSDCQRNESIPWETIIKLIEVYRMTQQLEKTWMGKVLSSEELKKYASFEQELKTRFNAAEEKECTEAWLDLVREVDASLDKDPASESGILLGKRCMNWVNNLYGKKYAGLRSVIWEKGFKGGHAAEEHGLSPASVAWLDKAIEAYYHARFDGLQKQIDTRSSDQVLKLWEDLLMDMYGDNESLKKDFIKSIMNDDKVSQSLKVWIKKNIR